MESRVEKFRTYREEIAKNEKKIEVERIDVTDEVIAQQNEDALKRNTLAISIDQIIEANDEYTLNAQNEKILREEKILKRKKIKKEIIRYSLIIVSILICLFILYLLVR